MACVFVKISSFEVESRHLASVLMVPVETLSIDVFVVFIPEQGLA